MKGFAIDRYGGPERLTLRELPEPLPGPDDLLVDIHAASVNPVDFKIRSGGVKVLVKDRFPLVLGCDCSGVVSKIGPGVTRFAPGDEVFARLRKDRIGTFDRIAKQVKLETVVDKASLDAGQLKTDGGFARLNKVFDGKLETLLGELADEVWKDAG
jgi:NADPH:quinone reductase-like Zn-dependent oxidoreductase